MRIVAWSGDALEDLEDAREYLGAHSDSAKHLFVERIKSALNMLAEMPVGRQGRVKGTYEWYVKRSPYIIAYALTETSIEVVHIIHVARDWPDDSWPADDA